MASIHRRGKSIKGVTFRLWLVIVSTAIAEVMITWNTNGFMELMRIMRQFTKEATMVTMVR